jgi:phenylalanyl-tRNA synthetase beta chain
MKVPLSWLKDFVDIDISIAELAGLITMAGMEVEAIQIVGLPMPKPGSVDAALSGLEWDREKIVVGSISEVMPHPNADRLVLCKLFDGQQEHVVLTGAPNLFEFKGKGPLPEPLKVAYAREGAQIYDGHQPGQVLVTLKRARIRGVDSYSMACSEKELGISEEHEGILFLDRAARAGTPLADEMGDAVLEVKLLPSYARCASILGLAREVAAMTGKALKTMDLGQSSTVNGPLSDAAFARIEITNPELNPRFVLGLIRDVEIRPSPSKVQQRLNLAGMRPINNIVDATNYVMIELGQPLHAFDYDILVERAGGQPPTIITRLPDPGEHLVTLDDEDHMLDDYNILVADTAGSLSMGGVMGGLESEIWDPITMGNPLDAMGIEVDENAEEPQHGKASTQRGATQNVLLEAANWNFINIRRTMQSQKMGSEAGMRFSRGVHPEMAPRGLLRGIELMRQISGGVVAQGIIDEYPLPAPTITVDLPISQVDRLLGISIPQAETVDILRRLEFEVVEDGDELHVTAPDHRMDIGTGVTGQADLIEEIARIYGYDRFPNTVIADMLPKQRANVSLEREEALRDVLARAGLREIVNYRLTTPEAEARLTPAGMASNWPEAAYVTLANPISADKVVMRHTLLASMLDILAANARHTDRQRLFEIGHVYLPVDGELLPDEPDRMGIVMTGPRDVPQWQGNGAPGLMDFFDLKGVIETMLRDLRIAGEPVYVPVEHNSFHPGRAAQLEIGGRPVGTLGEVHPLVREQFGLGLDLERPVIAAEFDLEALLVDVVTIREIAPVPTQPAVYQDIALIVDERIPAAEVEAVIRQAGGDLLEDARLFDVYRGDPIPAGKKSLAYNLTYRAPDRTLKDQEVAKVHAGIVRAAERRLGAELRA